MTFVQTDTFTIRGYETDALGRLSIPSLMNLMQESANRNALDYGIGINDLAKQGYGWMLMRFQLRMHQYPGYGDTIQVVTYPTFVEKYFIFRDFKVLASNGTVLAEASSTWLVFSTEKRTMVPMPDFIRRLTPPVIPDPAPRLTLKPAFQAISFEDAQTREVEVGWLSIDQNNHVNNVAYVQWILESIDRTTLDTRELAEIDLVYRTETHLGDLLQIQSISDTETTRRHRIEHSSTKKEVLIAQTTWRTNS